MTGSCRAVGWQHSAVSSDVRSKKKQGGRGNMILHQSVGASVIADVAGFALTTAGRF